MWLLRFLKLRTLFIDTFRLLFAIDFLTHRTRFFIVFTPVSVRDFWKNSTICSPNNGTIFLKPLRYFCSLPSLTEAHHSSAKFSLYNSSLVNTSNAIDINILPPSHHTPHNDPLYLRDKWFVNLSSFSIPAEVQSLLQLGENFSLPFFNTDKLTTEFIKNIENNIQKLPLSSQAPVRTRSAPSLTYFLPFLFLIPPSRMFLSIWRVL